MLPNALTCKFDLAHRQTIFQGLIRDEGAVGSKSPIPLLVGGSIAGF